MTATLENDNVSWDYTTGTLTSVRNTYTPIENGLDVKFTTTGGDTFIKDGININSSRLPIIQFGSEFVAKRYTGKNVEDFYAATDLENYYLPGISDKQTDGSYPYTGIVYFMCQATGYKQTSNKELPGYA
jgi:hypothetical protein